MAMPPLGARRADPAGLPIRIRQKYAEFILPYHRWSAMA
jgi:hypothetical protein